MAELMLDPATRGTERGTMETIERRFSGFANKNTWWRHQQAGTMDEFDRLFDEAVEHMRGRLGRTYPIVIDGREHNLDATFTVRSPADRNLILGHYAAASRTDTERAVAAARKGFAAWSRLPWQERAATLDRAADLYTQSFWDLCAAMTFETGKTRFEASIDVDEAIDFLRFYAMTMREMGGYDMEMGKPVPDETCRSVRKPWGVFAVLCPFNFPVAITTGMTAAALVTGNTVVMKPSQKGCLSGWLCFDLLRKAGVPAEALHYLTGTDKEVSTTLVGSTEVDGIAFTGSKQVGMMVQQKVLEHGRPKPVITEMGGKNAIIVTAKADLEKAVEGVWKSAFGFTGQKCSACSRVYVEEPVAKEFLERLQQRTDATAVGPPWKRETFMGPIIEERKMDLYKEVIKQVQADGGRIVSGGGLVEEDGDGEALHGNYVRPTVVTDLAKDHRVFREEFFMPFAAVAVVGDLDEALAEANKVQYGLTAGIFSEDKAELDRFFAGIQAGVTYANRRAGGSTAAVVNGQAFGGWKASGNTGNGAGGRYYLPQFTREQSQTVVG